MGAKVQISENNTKQKALFVFIVERKYLFIAGIKNRQPRGCLSNVVVELRLVVPELSTEHLSAYYIGFIACGLSYILFVLLAVNRFFRYHRLTHF